MEFCLFQRWMLPLCLALLTFVGSAQAQETRTWKDASGKFAIDAALLKVADGKVYLRTKGGRDVIVAIEKLCEADQAFLGVDSNPFQLADGTQEFASPLVVVRVSDDKNDFLLPGVVHCERDGQAFVVVDTLRIKMRGEKGRLTPNAPLKFTAAWDAQGERKNAPLDLKQAYVVAVVE